MEDCTVAIKVVGVKEGLAQREGEEEGACGDQVHQPGG